MATTRRERGANRAQRRMPIKTTRVELEGEYEGWWFDCRTNPPLGQWLPAMEFVTGAADLADTLENIQDASEVTKNDVDEVAQGLHVLLDSVVLVVRAWNYVDEEGNDIPCNAEGVKSLPNDLLALTFYAAIKAVSQNPLVTKTL